MTEKMTSSDWDRFWAEVQTGDGCWEWTGKRHQFGYGQVRVRGVRYLAHRFMMSWLADIDGKCVLHRCDNPPCVRPDHLFLGTRADNIRDMVDKGRGNSPRFPGERNAAAKLRRPDIPTIRLRIAAGESSEAIAADYEVTGGTIRHIAAGTTWRGVQ